MIKIDVSTGQAMMLLLAVFFLRWWSWLST